MTDHTRDTPQSFWSSHPMIPGGRDAANLTHREPGAVGGVFTGADIPADSPADWLDEATARERAREGGGDPRQPSTHHETDRKGNQ